MSKLRFRISMSLDGFTAGPHQSVDHPLGTGGEKLHEWAFRLEAFRRMRAGEFDVIDSIVETSKRQDYFDFTPAYTPVEASIFFRKDISGITDLASLKGFPVGAKNGDQHIEQLKAGGVTTLVLFQNNDAIIEAAKQHKINVFVVDNPSALYLLNKAGIEHEFRHSARIFRDELRRAVRKGDAITLRTVSEGFAAIQPGELKQIDEKWYGRTINRIGVYLTYAGYAMAVALLAGAFGTLGLLLAGLGLYGITAYAVTVRRSEIGIRMALGALPSTVLLSVLGGALVYMTIGLVIGVTIAVGLAELVRGFLFEIQPHDPTVYAGVLTVLAMTGLAAAFLPARRAAAIDPLVALRAE